MVFYSKNGKNRSQISDMSSKQHKMSQNFETGYSTLASRFSPTVLIHCQDLHGNGGPQ
jgi:hypothetical protein